MTYYLAIDIGASSGRHILGHLEQGRVVLEEVYRFDNTLITLDDATCWDMPALFGHVVAGIAACKKLGKVPRTIAIDTWGVDFVLLDSQGTALTPAVSYRDGRTEGMTAVAEGLVPFPLHYSKTGIQKQTFNTIYQLLAIKEKTPEILERAASLLMIPDYLNYLLTGVLHAEYTNATTTALVNAKEKTWDKALIEHFGLPSKIFLPLQLPGVGVGPLKAEIAAQTGVSATVIHAPSHDTASAFLAVPARGLPSVYISSGTWSLLGVENKEAITSPQSQVANFSNEGGYDYRFRYLKNIMGLWMIQSIRRETNKQHSFAALEALARENARFPSLVDVNRQSFLAPDSMLGAIADYCKASGQTPPGSLGESMSCVYKSLAESYRQAIETLSALTGVSYQAIHIVGGGSQDDYLNTLTAATCGLPVYAGPKEGTALGNLLCQFIADGVLETITDARAAVRNSFEVKEFLV